MEHKPAGAGKMPAPSPSPRPTVARPAGSPLTARPLPPPLPPPLAVGSAKKAPLRTVLVVALLAGLILVGSLNLVLPRGASPEALATDDYIFSVKGAVANLDMVFSQADLTVKAVQAGWLAPEGAANEFQFLHEQVKGVKATVSASTPPAHMEEFHRNLGRTLSLTQQAMDAMQAGFATGDGSYFDLAHEKLAEARASLTRAINAL